MPSIRRSFHPQLSLHRLDPSVSASRGSTVEMTCIYCGGPGPFTAEHVLARALVGEGNNLTLIDLVCHVCNSVRFAACEREWIAFPGLAMSRIFFGPAGRKRKGIRYRVHPGDQIYLVANGDPIAYEVEILDGLKPQIRGQVIGLEHGLLACAADMSGGGRLQAAIDRFVSEREITAYKHPDQTRRERFLIAMVGSVRAGPSPAIVGYEWRGKPTNVWLDRFPRQPPRTPLHARMSVDQDDRLRIRAENIETAIALFRRVLREVPLQGKAGRFEGGAYDVAMDSAVDIHQVNRAVAKTAFNLAIHALGADAMRSPAFDRCRRYCWEGTGDDKRHPFVGTPGEAAMKMLPSELRTGNTDRHTLFLTSNGQALVCFIQLYGGATWKVHFGTLPAALQPLTRCFRVDYNGAGFLP